MGIWRKIVGGWLLCVICTTVTALDQIEITLGDLQGEGWRAQALTLHVDLPAGAELSGEITLDELVLPAPIGPVGAVRVRCDTLQHDAAGTRCTGRMEIARLLGEAVAGTVRIEHEAASGRVQVALQEARLAAGRWRIEARLQEGRWHLAAQGKQVDAAAARELLHRALPDFEYRLTGRLNLDARFEGDAAGVADVQVNLDGDAVDFANASGTQAGEKLGVVWSGRAQRRTTRWDVETQARFAAGALFADPLYLEFAPGAPLRLAASGQWDEAAGRLRLPRVTLDHPGVLQAQADLVLRKAAPVVLESVAVELPDARLPGAYVNYIQPWLRGQVGDALETAGRFSGRFRYRAGGETALRLQLQDVDIDDAGERFGFSRLAGVIDWGSDDAARTTQLRWQSGSLYRLALGEAQLAVVSRGAQFELREPARIPVLDGVLMIDDLALSDPGGEDMRWRFDGVLTPVSMEAVCAALDWPKFSGRLSGMIPEVSYEQGVLAVGGVLLVHAFDGDLTVRDLRLEQPFGRVPRLTADLAVDQLDLDALTSTFSFGKIEGRLNGYVKRLYMESWQPVAFDASLFTPEGDDSRHRISQKAVDNLSSIGGGVGGALSRSFLGMFEEFPYDRLGLSCVLDNGVCRMGGIAPADGGYYIVKGRFLPPRIDVVGFADQVDWHTLVDRLKSVTLEEAPVVR